MSKMQRCLLVAMILGLVAAQTSAQCVQHQRLTASDAWEGDAFGRAVSVSGNTAVVGAIGDACASGFAGCGSVYVFRYDGISWAEEQRLTASDAAGPWQFGSSVSVSGNTVVVGEDLDLGQRGSAYVFRFDGNSWFQEQKLIASDAAMGDRFGVSVSVSGDAAVVGARYDDCATGGDCGSTYVYRFNGTSWVEEQKLTASDAGTGDCFGYSVSMSGNTAVVGAYLDDCVSSDCGSAYIFRFDGTSWVEEQKLTPSDAAPFDRFGISVSVSGETVIVGAERDHCAAGPYCGSAYVFRFDGNSWFQEQKFIASDAAMGDRFGISVSVSGDAAVVGARYDDCAEGGDCGAAYVFRFDGTSWVEERKLVASDVGAEDWFGSAVSVSGNTAVAGAFRDDCSAGNGCGSAYLFELDQPCPNCGDGKLDPNQECDGGLSCTGCLCDPDFEPTVPPSLDCQPICGNGVIDAGEECEEGLGCAACRCEAGFEPTGPPSLVCRLTCRNELPQCLMQQKLTASADASAEDKFGVTVSLSGNVAVVGALWDGCASGSSKCGSAYVFRFDGTCWIEEQKLIASDAAAFDMFGTSVSVSGDTVIVGARRDNCAVGIYCGAAYVFRFNGTSWDQKQKLTASDAAAFDMFGTSVSVSGDTVIVGARRDDCAAGVSCGSAYVFRFNGAAWDQEQRLTASDAAAYDIFGNSVSVSGNTAVVGAKQDACAAGVSCGSAYVFRFNGTSWNQEQKLTASDVAAIDFFGVSVSVSGDTAIVGAFFDDCAAGENCGSAYVFRFNGTSWHEEQKLAASDAAEGDRFGYSVSVSGDTAAIGAASDDCAAGADCGSAYVFRFDGTSWVEERKLTAADAEPGDAFGWSISVSGETAVVGAFRNDCVAGFNCGSAYVFCFAEDPEPVPVDLDIKPGSCPNPVNPKSKGVVPVAIVGGLDFDVATVDPDSLTLARADGVGESVSPLSARRGPGIVIKDVATPFVGEPCACHELGGDGMDDLALKFSTADMSRAFQLDGLPRGTTIELVLRGTLQDGTTFEGVDCIVIPGTERNSNRRHRTRRP